MARPRSVLTYLWHRATGALALAAAAGCGGSSAPVTPTSSAPASSPAAVVVARPAPAGTEAEQLDIAFPVDLQSVEAIYDVFPAERRIAATATVEFTMRAGRSRSLLHFAPAVAGQVSALRLDGQTLDPRSGADVAFVTFGGSSQIGMELQRDLGAGVHRLEAAYALQPTDAFGRFTTTVNDLVGIGNEGLWPTLNSPRELARHRLTFRVHGAEPYRLVGSGLVTATSAGDVQQWTLDSEREVASYTVLFYLVPGSDVVLAERTVDGVPVRVLSYVGGPSVEEAFDQLGPWLAELQRELGPFPMPRGLSVVLTGSGGGMEYFGGTITSLRALRHEVFHMYFGCSTVARTYRDSWWDEAINSWYELSADPGFAPIAEDFRSDLVSARTPIGVGFDRRAYDEGARVFQALAVDVGGRGPLVGFLRELREARTFDPFGTMDLADELQARRGVDAHARFQRWLYTGGAAGAARGVDRSWLHVVDITPPPGIRPR